MRRAPACFALSALLVVGAAAPALAQELDPVDVPTEMVVIDDPFVVGDGAADGGSTGASSGAE